MQLLQQSPGENPDQHSPSHHQCYLLVGQGPALRVVSLGDMTGKGGCGSYILSEVVPILVCVGEKRISCSLYGRKALATRENGTDGLFCHWDRTRRLIFPWCHWLWSHGGTCRSSPVLFSCICVEDLASLVSPVC